MRASAWMIAAGLGLAGCAQYASVKPAHPRLTGPPGTGELALAEQAIVRAQTHDRAKPLVALGDCLDALQVASRELHRDPGNALARRDYNFALGRAFEI